MIGIPITRKKSGFALIATILLMVLLAIITVGTLSLSVVTLRNAGHDSAQNLARANARMALMIAIGELQKHTGLDTRVTAPSSIVEYQANPSSQPGAPLIGVWQSWEGSDHDSTTGRPKAPIYDEKQKVRFLRWLVSGTKTTGTPAEKLAELPTLAFTEAQISGSKSTVPLISTGTLEANSTQQVHVYPQEIGQKGAFAWWVSGENQKARLLSPYKPETTGLTAQVLAARWSEHNKSHSIVDPSVFDLNGLLNDANAVIADKASSIPSLGTVELLATKLGDNPKVHSREYFHDLSTTSMGLLTNTATGGWRKDLSILSERWNNMPLTDLPMFRLDTYGYASTIDRATKTAANVRPAVKRLFYPWRTHSGSTTNHSLETGSVGSWGQIIDFATAYRTKMTLSSGMPKLNFISPFSGFSGLTSGGGMTATEKVNNLYTMLHEITIMPIVARFEFRLSVWTDPLGTTPETYALRFLLTPYVTLWNPYNAQINIPNNFNIDIPVPPATLIRYKDKDGNLPAKYNHLFRGSSGGAVRRYPYPTPTNYPTTDLFSFENCNIAFNTLGGKILKPGETLFCSPAAGQLITTFSGGAGATISMDSGDRSGVGFLKGFGPAYNFAPATPIEVDAKFDCQVAYAAGGFNNPGAGIFFWIGANPPGKTIPSYMSLFAMTTPTTGVPQPGYTGETYDVNAMWPPMLAANGDIAVFNAKDCTSPRALLSTVLGPRIASETAIQTKGMAQTSLFSFAAERSGEAGGRHPANLSLDLGFVAHPSGGSSALANSSGSLGYIVTGNQSGNGLSNPVFMEIPLRPMASLAELQHWDLKYRNIHPPHQYYIIGNSDASPLIAKDRAHRSNQQHDDSYCANHLLFDDWFLSSIAPRPDTYGPTGTATNTIQSVYESFLKGETPLVNRAYRAIAEDEGLTSTQITTRTNEMILSAKGWQQIASRLEVEGMFNVNSTSKTAWRALLGHARNQRVPYLAGTSIDLSTATDYTFSRSTVAGDRQADNNVAGFSNPVLPGSSEYTGYRVFTDEMLDQLAEKIVEQVRLRGPFLSLSEFLNRQLSSNNNLALAGAIQTALNNMDKDPHEFIKTVSVDTTSDPNAAHLFPEAANSNKMSLYGIPGWIRQADVLRPIAPILSARDDTFTIRAYGDARDAQGKVTASAWCEATVRRGRDYVDPSDQADLGDQTNPSASVPQAAMNNLFGRRYRIISFRWLSSNEV